ncbi:MAG: hypothetical protein ACJ77E_21480 [Gaiellaceae bacterium]
MRVRERAAHGAASFDLLVPNAAEHSEITDAERHRRHEEVSGCSSSRCRCCRKLQDVRQAGPSPVRHDSFDTVEETLHDGEFDEVIIATLRQTSHAGSMQIFRVGATYRSAGDGDHRGGTPGQRGRHCRLARLARVNP